MSVFRRAGSPYFYTAFQIGGARFLRSTGKTTEREAQAEAKRIRAAIKGEVAKRRAADALTLDQAFGKYWTEHAEKTLSPTWRAEVFRYSQQIITMVPATTLVEHVDDALIDEFVQARVRDGAGSYAINRALAVWRRVHNLASKRWKQRTHAIDWSEFVNKEHKRVRSLTRDEARILIEKSPLELARAIRWSLLTGCRKAETYSLRWDDIDLVVGKAVVVAKGGRRHTVWLSDDARALLEEIPRRGQFVFFKSGQRTQFDKALAAAGIQDFRWHDLRHTFATWMRQEGVALEVVQRALGHADLATTERYAHVADAEVLAAMQKVWIQPTSKAASPANIVRLSSVKSVR